MIPDRDSFIYMEYILYNIRESGLGRFSVALAERGPPRPAPRRTAGGEFGRGAAGRFRHGVPGWARAGS
eukprot:COSAG02_NODE_15904_length_1131_cov_599.629845_1_plen_68_part_10